MPAWSPDGAKIAWTRSLPGWLADVFVMNADGSGQTRLTNIGAAGAPSWSPDGAKIAFRTTRDGGSSEIYTMNADGTGQVNITNTAETKEWAPAWTPANKIVFVRNYQIYTMNPDGSSPTQVVDDGGINNFPTWSPTTGQIAYNDHDDGEVARINANGTGHTTLTSVGNNLSPSWGPVCTSHPFSDVPAWVTASVDWAFCGSVMSGYPGTTFRPILSISRGQVASALYEAAGSPDTSTLPTPPWTDVPAWIDGPARWVADNGYMTGYPDNTFRPSLPITRGQVSRATYRVHGSPGAPPHPFTDVPAWLTTAVNWAANDPPGSAPPLMTGYGDGTFRDTLDITRAQTARLTCRANTAPGTC